MREKISINILERFLSNKSDYKEAEKVFLYLSQNEEALDEIQIFEGVLEEDILITPNVKKDLIYKNISNRQRTSRVISIKGLLIAATLLGLLLVAGYYFKNSFNTAIPKETVLVKETKIVNTTSSQIDYQLPDGSKLTLLPGAEVVFGNDFILNRAINQVIGDVYYRVKKDENHFFSVIANGIKTTALGTEFWIRDNKKLNSITISLTTGKVSIQSIDSIFSMNSVILTPGQVCHVNRNTGEVLISGIKATSKNQASNKLYNKAQAKIGVQENEVLWTNKELTFTNTKLDNVLQKLEQKYNVTIVVNDPTISNTYLTGRILYKDSLSTIIRSISQLNNLSYKRSNDTIFLEKK